ncbi:MAG: PA14 domain-containing protein [Acidobacteriaceae bacterium]|jgi:hypothetical protein
MTGDDKQYTLRVASREVLVDVVALNTHNHPVPDMAQSDFQIFEVAKQSRSPRSITAFRIIDPASQTEQPDPESSILRATSTGGCATRTTLHYQLAFHASSEGWTSGFHDVLVTTSRPGVHLSFRNHYYVGVTYVPAARPRKHNAREEDAALERATCVHSDVPPSISLTARLIQTANTDRLRYSLLVSADSLAFTSVTDETKQVRLDYGICTFNAMGQPLRYTHTSIQNLLTDDEYLTASAQGFRYELELDRKGSPTLARFVVRDRETGNIGIAELSIAPPPSAGMEASIAAARPQKYPVGLFGSVIPSPNTLCGDVYELAAIPRVLAGGNFPASILNYNEMDSVGAIYAKTLNVPLQILPPGALGVSAATEWFGIDYYGEFWIKTPGDYTFVLIADEGAQLFIDDELVIDLSAMNHLTESTERSVALTAGRHTLHLPYVQAITHLELILKVKPPGGDFRPFDLHDFPPNYRVNSRVLPGFQVVPGQP